MVKFVNFLNEFYNDRSRIHNLYAFYIRATQLILPRESDVRCCVVVRPTTLRHRSRNLMRPIATYVLARHVSFMRHLKNMRTA